VKESGTDGIHNQATDDTPYKRLCIRI